MRYVTHSTNRSMTDVKTRRCVRRPSCHSERKKKTSDTGMLHYHQEDNIPEWTRKSLADTKPRRQRKLAFEKSMLHHQFQRLRGIGKKHIIM